MTVRAAQRLFAERAAATAAVRRGTLAEHGLVEAR
jgi:hypothetical protein